jgi:hypothetical protein
MGFCFFLNLLRFFFLFFDCKKIYFFFSLLYYFKVFAEQDLLNLYYFLSSLLGLNVLLIRVIHVISKKLFNVTLLFFLA